MNHLPPEVLTSCATFVSDTDPRPIVALTHVCRYWRTSISSNPRNWASISTGWKRLAPLCLERAGAVPLAININVPDINGDSNFLQALFPHVARVASLSLAGYSFVEAVAGNIPGFFDFPMVNLTSLELRQATEPVGLFPSRSAPVPPIFQNVSKLKSLCLTRTPLYHALFGITSLVELKLVGYKNTFHFGTFIGFLGSNPNLEIVALDVGFTEGSIWTVPARMTSLARLRGLSITCVKPIDAKGLLSCITLQHGISLEVSCTQWTPLDLCLPSPPTTIQKVLTPIAVIKFRAAPTEVHAIGDNSLFSFRCPQPRLFWIPELYLLPTTSVREFHANFSPWTLTPAFLVSIFTRLPALETLALANVTRWATGIFDPLAGQSLCPSLKTMAFHDCIFTPEAMKEFEGVVERRKGSAAARLYRVVFVSSTGILPDYTLIQQIRRHVPCVDVRVDDKLPDLS